MKVVHGIGALVAVGPLVAQQHDKHEGMDMGKGMKGMDHGKPPA